MILKSRDSLIARWLAGVVVAVAFGSIWFALATAADVDVVEMMPRQGVPPREALSVINDGEIIICSNHTQQPTLLNAWRHRRRPSDIFGRRYRDRRFRELNGGVLKQASMLNVSPHRELFGWTDAAGLSASRVEPGWSRGRLKYFWNERDWDELWYFVHNGERDGAGFFVGYEWSNKRLIGHIGLAGFRQSPPPESECIPVRGEAALSPGSWSSSPRDVRNVGRGVSEAISAAHHESDVPPRLVHVPSRNVLRVIDLDARTIETVLEAPAPILAVDIPPLLNGARANLHTERPILVRTAQTIDVLDHQYNKIRSVSLPTEVRPDATLSLFELTNGRMTIASPLSTNAEEEAAGATESRWRVYRVSADGRTEETLSTTLATGLNPRMSWQEAALRTLVHPAPALMFASGGSTTLSTRPLIHHARLRRAFPALAATTALAAVLALLTWRRCRAFGFSVREQTLWTVFTLLFGLPAFVGFRLHRRWPTREDCPHCQTSAPRDRETCAACEAPFPTPALQGTEIFA